jgi:hypothetical protein
MSKHDATQWYTAQFKAWPKQAGPKPTAELLETVHRLGARPGKQAMANAMYLRECGATTAQVCMVVGAPQLNKMRALRDSAKVIKQIPASKNEAGHTVYRIELTAKGLNKVKAAAEAPVDAKPVKAKRKAKANKPAAEAGVDVERAQAEAMQADANAVQA